jgi:glycosyltransferase involved in cell wall biosynthesis
VPVVATDVGDSAWIVGDTGEIVPPRSPAALAEAWERMLVRLAKDRASVHAAARQRIEMNFGTARLAERTAELLEQTARSRSTQSE